MADGMPRWPAGRWLPALAAAALYGLLALLYLRADMEDYATAMRWLGGEATAEAFVDTHAVLSALDCHRQGIDVYAENPCDMLGRIHAYSPFWLHAAFLRLDTTATPVLGLLLGLAFIAGLAFLPPARGGRDILLMTLACCSATTVYALERANNDLLVWLLVLLAVLSLRRAWPRRALGYGAGLLAGLLKFYPLVLLILALREPPRRMASVVLAALALFGGIVALDVASWRRSLAAIPGVRHSIDMFGAVNLPYGLAEGLWRMGLTAWWVAPGLLAIFTCYAAALSVRLVIRLDLTRQAALLGTRERLFLMAGAALIVGCFFTASSVFYRGIHFLFVLPVLLALSRRAARPVALACLGAAIAIVAVMSTEAVRHLLGQIAAIFDVAAATRQRIDLLVWAAHELLLWWAVSFLGAWLLALAMVSDSGACVLRAIGPYWPSRFRARPP